MNKVIAVFGPTASGKSSLALSLAEHFGGVIISADSMQLYQEMDVGTAKPTKEEMKRIPHKMIDICAPSKPFSVYDYKKQAEDEIEASLKADFVPIVAGGTGLYFDALFFNNDFGEMEVDPAIRKKLNERANAGEGSVLLAELYAVDPATAAPLHEKDLKRIIRGLEVFYSTGKPLSYYKELSRKGSSRFNYLKLFLNYKDRSVLYDRINRRVDMMLQNGLLEETKELLEMGCFDSPTASQAIGYKELLPYLQGFRSLDECVSLLKQKTRNYAKRQLTWFRRYEDAQIIWMDAGIDPLLQAKQLCEKFLQEV